MLDVNSPLKVLYVGTLSPQGAGATLSSSELLAGLSSQGHRIRALRPSIQEETDMATDFAKAHPSIQVERYVMPYLELDPYNPEPNDYRILQCERIIDALSEMVSREHPDVILIGRESFVWNIPEFAKEHSIGCVLTARGVILAILNKIFPGKLGRELLNHCRAVNLIVTCAEHMARSMQTLGFSNLKVIRNAVDTSRFYPGPRDATLARRMNIKSSDTVVLHMSHLHSWKRPLDLVNSASQALSKNGSLIYVIAGDGPCKEAMEIACSQLGLKERFRFTGWVGYADVPKYMRLADIVVMPSDFEGMARVYLEAQACGRVLLASDIPAAREVVTDGITGMLFRKGDVADLASKTLAAARNPAFRTELGKMARKHIEAKHALEDNVREYATALQSVAQQR